jgi:branched-chain amino acid transport system substrate-binding protein
MKFQSIPRRALLGFTATTLLSFSAFSQDKSIVIGQTTALSGAAAAVAVPFTQGAQLVFDKVNAAGGVAGRTIVVNTLDDAGNPATAKANATKLAAGGAVLMFGGQGSATTMAVHEAAASSGLFLFAPQSNSDELHGANFPGIYFLRPGDSEQSAAIIKHAETLGAKKLAIVHGKDSDSLSTAEAAERTMSSLGANLVSKTGLEALDKALASNPQSLLMISDTAGAASVVKTARAKGFKGPIYGFANTGESLLAEQLGAAGAGVVLARVVPRSDNAKVPLVRELIADAQAAKLPKPNVYMLEGYIAAKALVEAMRRSGKDLSRAKLRKTLESLNEWDSGGFRVSFDGGHVGSKLVELSLIDSQGKLRE